MLGLEIPLAALAGYIIGSIPPGVIIGRLRGIDPRGTGSRRTGTTNALRTLGPLLATVVFILDVTKGVLAAFAGGWVAQELGADEAWPAAVAGIAAVVGHVRSVFISFGGGRGVATGGGAMLVLAPLAVAAAIPVFALLVWQTRYVSLGSIAAAIAVALGTGLIYAVDGVGLHAVVASGVIASVVVMAHGDNIQRLRSGTERKLSSG